MVIKICDFFFYVCMKEEVGILKIVLLFLVDLRILKKYSVLLFVEEYFVILILF